MEDSQTPVPIDVAQTEVLLSGLDDWVSLAEAQSIIRDTLTPGAAESEVRARTLGAVGDLLRRHLMEAGELRPRFVAWRGNPEDLIDRIAREWPDDEDLWVGKVCWLANTSSGAALAESLSDR